MCAPLILVMGFGSIFATNHRVGPTIDDRLHNRFVGRHFENIRSWTVGRGSDISDHSIRDVDKNLSNVDVVLYRRRCDICADDFYILVEANFVYT